MLVLAGAAVTALSACSLLTSLDGLSGAAPPVDATDGANDARSANDARATTDAGDGATDAPWCATNAPDASFCTAFESTELTQFESTSLLNGTLSVDGPNALSPPYALLATAPAITTGTANAYVYRETRPSVSEVAVEVALRLEKASTATGALQIMKLLTTSGPMSWETGLAIDGVTRRLFVYHYDADTGVYDETFSVGPQPLDAWSTLRFQLKLAASGPGLIDLDVDGARVATGLSVASPPAGTSSFGLFVGVAYVKAPHSGWTARFDNLVLDTR